jgi:CRP-like cAMP-binding protein
MHAPSEAETAETARAWWHEAHAKHSDDAADVERELQHVFGGGCRGQGRRACVADRGCEVISAGMPNRRLCRLNSGLAARVRNLPQGRQVILDIHRPGDFMGLDTLFFARALDSSVALTTVGYWSIEHAALRELLQQPKIVLRLMEQLVEEKRRVDALATLLGQAKARERTAALLLFLWRRLRFASGDTTDGMPRTSARLPLTQKQMADYLGVNVVHLNRTLADLRACGMVRFQDGVITVLDQSRLEQIANRAAAPV